ncbi:hypothetical protein AKUG0403_01650 [Apilactobacillus kunkeei]|nr:hypothetical protein AKUG0403_01650 [Apilactobacillus kunkeei]
MAYFLPSKETRVAIVITQIETPIGYYIKALRNAGMSIERLLEFVHLYLKDIDDLDRRKELLIEQRKELLAEIAKQQETVDYLTFKIDHFEEHVMNQKDENKGE